VLALRGLVLFLSGKLPPALQHTQSALRLDPSHTPAQQLRKRVREVERLKEEGNVAFKAGSLQEAAEKYGEALEVSFACSSFSLGIDEMACRFILRACPCWYVRGIDCRGEGGGGERRPDTGNFALKSCYHTAQGVSWVQSSTP
jgi:hypothetical protein